jgi:CRP-like cAMP-binding protein
VAPEHSNRVAPIRPLKPGLLEEPRNRIIAALSETSRRGLRSALERMETKRGQVLSVAGTTLSHFYFIESGMVSLVKWMRNGEGVEITAVGPEGIVPPGVVVDFERAVLESIVQIPGSVLRIRRDDLRRRLARDHELLTLMRSYAETAMSQLAQTAACNILHPVEARCCRWLLMAHDSAHSDNFQLTHEFLGMMLGVRRATVSVAAEALQRAGLIHYSHGNLTITDRPALERVACECYATTRSEFADLFAARPASA